MDHELQLVNDGDGIVVLGEAQAVDSFLASQGLASQPIDRARLKRALGTASSITEAGAQITENSGRWVKLTEGSAKALKQGQLMKGSQPEVSRAIVTSNGKTAHILEIVKTPSSILMNPAVLTGVAGIMAQVAMQQAMDEISAYLKRIDEKCDDILRRQKDAILASVVGTGALIDEALEIRQERGHIPDVTWSKLQGSAHSLATALEQSLLELDAIANKVRNNSLSDLKEIADALTGQTREWLAVVARCLQLQDALAVIEIDRVSGDHPDDADAHQRGLRRARDNRLHSVGERTASLRATIESAVQRANEDRSKLLHPRATKSVSDAGIAARDALIAFHEVLLGEVFSEDLATREWREAAEGARDKALAATREAFTKAGGVAKQGTGKATTAFASLATSGVERLKKPSTVERQLDSDD